MSTPEPVVTDVRGVLVKVGLGQPTARAFVAGALVGVAAYALQRPAVCWDEDGELRPFKALSASPHATYAHFLWVPVTAAAATFLFI